MSQSPLAGRSVLSLIVAFFDSGLENEPHPCLQMLLMLFLTSLHGVQERYPTNSLLQVPAQCILVMILVRIAPKINPAIFLHCLPSMFTSTLISVPASLFLLFFFATAFTATRHIPTSPLKLYFGRGREIAV